VKSLLLGLLLAGLLAGNGDKDKSDTAVGKIQTVTGAINPEQLGPALEHEHLLVDFVGADQVSPDRYDADEVFEVMLPYLVELKAAGIEALFECTPEWLGRDPALLKRLSKASGVRLITNTGWYKAPFLPAWAEEATAEEIAEGWIREATEGIEPSGIKPGFIKIAASESELTPIQRKIARAAALTSKATGLVIASHTTTASVALVLLDVLAAEGVPASRFIWVHADADPQPDIWAEAARRGAWLSFDGLRKESAEVKLPLVLQALERWPDQLLISQDAGWYNVGEERGGQQAPFDWLPREFVPALVEAGADETAVYRLLRENVAEAFTIPRPLTEE
jgi:phosphotriesterase-related protein